MGDERLRELERRWRETPSPIECARWASKLVAPEAVARAMRSAVEAVVL